MWKYKVEAMKQILSIREAAEFLSISHDTMYKYAIEGTIPGFKLGNRWRFDLAKIYEWIEKQYPESKP